MENFPTVAAFIVICYCVGFALKKTEKFKDNFIPVVMVFLGAALGVVSFYIAPGLVNAPDIISAVAIGFMSGMTATGINQLYKQIKEAKNEVQ